MIDNIHVNLADVLNRLLSEHYQPQIDIATAYFSVRGYELLRDTLPGVRHFRSMAGYGEQQVLFDYLSPLVGIVGSSNFTAPGLKHNNELNLVHKTLLLPGEVDDQYARSEVKHHKRVQPSGRISPDNQLILKSEVGARAISTWRSGSMVGGRKLSTSRKN